MNAFQRGFADGEHASFFDRKYGKRRRLIGEPLGDYQRGFAAGYMPRDLSWLLSGTAPRPIAFREDDEE